MLTWLIQGGSLFWNKQIWCYYSKHCYTAQIWSWWCTEYSSSVDNRYPAIYVISCLGEKNWRNNIWLSACFRTREENPVLQTQIPSIVNTHSILLSAFPSVLQDSYSFRFARLTSFDRQRATKRLLVCFSVIIFIHSSFTNEKRY